MAHHDDEWDQFVEQEMHLGNQDRSAYHSEPRLN